MAPRHADPSLVRQRHLLRADRLKRRATAASLLGFVSFFALAAQHVVRGASASSGQAARSSQRSVPSRANTYFDQADSGFSFGGSGSSFSSDLPQASQPPPVAQTSVS